MRLNEEDKALLKRIFGEEYRKRLHEGDIEEAVKLKSLEFKILDPTPDIDWSQTAVGRRVAARDAELGTTGNGW